MKTWTNPLSHPEVGLVKDALWLAKQLVEFADWRGEDSYRW